MSDDELEIDVTEVTDVADFVVAVSDRLAALDEHVALLEAIADAVRACAFGQGLWTHVIAALHALDEQADRMAATQIAERERR